MSKSYRSEAAKKMNAEKKRKAAANSKKFGGTNKHNGAHISNSGQPPRKK